MCSALAAVAGPKPAAILEEAGSGEMHEVTDPTVTADMIEEQQESEQDEAADDPPDDDE